MLFNTEVLSPQHLSKFLNLPISFMVKGGLPYYALLMLYAPHLQLLKKGSLRGSRVTHSSVAGSSAGSPQ